jgi:hypothetical protein
MPDLVGDIKKIDQDKISEGREILLKYLAEVDQAAETKVKSPEKKSLDSLTSKAAEVRSSAAPAAAARQVEAKIDFVKDFKTAESKFHKPIKEIIHDVMAKQSAAPPVKPEKVGPVAASARTVVIEKDVSEKPAVIKTAEIKPPQENPPAPQKAAVPPIKKITAHTFQWGIRFRWNDLFRNGTETNKRKLARSARLKQKKTVSKEKKVTAALDYLGRIVFKFLSAVTAFAIIYFVFCLSLYTFGFDNGVTRLITKIFPVPAFVTQYGVVNYYDYIDAKNEALNDPRSGDRIGSEVLASIAAREKLIKRQVLAGLAKNYGLSVALLGSTDREVSLENRLALMIVADPSINLSNLRKLRAIKSTLLGGADFTLTAGSFGLSAKTQYFDLAAVREKFGSRALELAASSTIETTSVKQGYYVFQFYNQQDGLTGFKFIFVPAVTLESIMADKLKAANLIILAD